MRKSWHLHRRMFLRGTGVALALPLLESMTWAAGAESTQRPQRFCAVYFANGVSLPPEKHPDHKAWHWFPLGEGRDYHFTQTLRSLEPLREEITILGGLSHPLGRKLVGHATADIWLTGGDVRGTKYRNTVSLDQLIARHVGKFTRIPSIVLSSNGGVGYKTRAATVSFDSQGQAIPAESSPREIFGRLFGQNGRSRAAKEKRLAEDRQIVDLVLEESRALRRQLGSGDRRKLDEYLSSVSEIERRIDRTEAWLDTPRPQVNPAAVNLEADQSGPEDYIRTMYDLMFLAFQTDTTRAATFQISQEDGKGVSDKFPALALGLSGHHSLSHGSGKEGGFKRWGQYDQFLAQQHAYFLDRLKRTSEENGSLLDSTIVLYGSATSTTHNARNYPLVLAGGQAMGLQHGKFLKFSEKTPLSNLFVTLLDRMQAPVESFADSTGELSDVFLGAS